MFLHWQVHWNRTEMLAYLTSDSNCVDALLWTLSAFIVYTLHSFCVHIVTFNKAIKHKYVLHKYNSNEWTGLVVLFACKGKPVNGKPGRVLGWSYIFHFMLFWQIQILFVIFFVRLWREWSYCMTAGNQWKARRESFGRWLLVAAAHSGC